jgi:hypothetical protein
MTKLPADVKARFLAQYDDLMRWRPPLAKPRLVADGGRIVGDADVVVSPEDPNWWKGYAIFRDGKISVSKFGGKL